MKKYRQLFLDFDDTLYDTRGNAIISLKEVYDEMHLGDRLSSETLFYENYWRANTELWGLYGKGEIKRDYLIIERFRRPLAETCDGPTDWITDEYCLKVSDCFLDHCSVKPGVVEGAHELMQYLKSKGYGLHICSNGFHEVQFKKLRASGLHDYFDTIILSEDAGVNKPSPLFFDYALEKSGAERSETLMIGDNYNSDIIGAMNSGIDTLLFNRWGQTEFEKQPMYITDTLKEIMEIL